MARRRARRAPSPTSPRLDEARAVARSRFGVARLHPEQERAIDAVLAGRDTLVVLPTGFGKSLVYQVPAVVLDRPVVVISPLIALMRDQERGLRAAGVPVVRLDSTLRVAARRQGLARVSKGGSLVVLTTPESLGAEDVSAALERAKPALLCVDEAHCISEWGHDFRPAYLRLGAERRALGIPTALALTATATAHVCDDITERLGLREPEVVRASPHRDNLVLRVVPAPGNLKFEAAGRLLRDLPRPGIVYCATTKAVDEVFAALSRAQIPCARYHGKMKPDERAASQRRFMKEEPRLWMIATSAFGMGIDKASIRSIVHFQVPGSLEQYVQEAGRAGRDGRRADCVLLFDPDDLSIQEFLAEQSRPTGAQLRRVGLTLRAYLAEELEPTSKDLALAARVPKTVVDVACAQLEQLGLVEHVQRRWRVRSSPALLEEASADLGERAEIQRHEDAHRLAAMALYASSERCRSWLIQRWFGEEEPGVCGRCDRCVRNRTEARRVSTAIDRAKAAPLEGEPPRRRRRRRRRRGARGGDGSTEVS